jgi:hypothetical protein
MKDQTELDPYVDAHLADGHSLDVARALAQADWAASHRPGDEAPAGESSELSEHVQYAPVTSPAPGETLRIEVNR